MAKSYLITAALAVSLSGCNTASDEYRLYTTWITDETKREYIATFDAGDDYYDRGNCTEAARLFRQADLTRKYWCEGGE